MSWIKDDKKGTLVSEVWVLLKSLWMHNYVQMMSTTRSNMHMYTQICRHDHIVFFGKLCGILSRPIPIVHSNSTTHMSSPKHTQRMVVVELGKAFRMPLLWHGLLMYVWLTSWKKGYCREMNPHTHENGSITIHVKRRMNVDLLWARFLKSIFREKRQKICDSFVVPTWDESEILEATWRAMGRVPPDLPTPEIRATKMLHWHRNGAALLRNFFSFIFLSGRSGDARDISSRKSNYTPSYALCVRLFRAWD